jgi:hypothetical protein
LSGTAQDLSGGSVPRDFRKASLCEAASCVEVSMGEIILVRNSDAPGTTIAFSQDEWRVFTEAVRLGEFEVE